MKFFQFNSTSFFKLNRYLKVSTLTSQLDQDSGILYTGCSSTSFGGLRRKRQSVISNCSLLTSPDPTLTTSVARKICDIDSLVNPSYVDATRVAVDFVNRTRAADNQKFSSYLTKTTTRWPDSSRTSRNFMWYILGFNLYSAKNKY